MDYETFNKGCLEEAKRLYKTANADQRYILEKLFPELKESEDEKIRKEIISALKYANHKGVYDKHIAWLEKQGEKLPVGFYYVNSEGKKFYSDTFKYGDVTLHVENQTKQKSADSYCQENCKGFQETGKCFADGMCKAKREAESVDKAEPKFKVGNWIVDKYGLTQQVLDFRGGIYTCTYNSFTTDCESNYHLWNIQDAKHGDVLAYDTVVLIFDHLGTFENRPIIYSWYFADSKKFYGMGTSDPDRWEVEGFYPATKEQRDLLFQKMEEDGYEWDAEKKELKKIHVIDEGKSEMDYCFTKMMNGEKVTTAWSEKDEKYIKDLFDYFTGGLSLKHTEEDIVDWLKSLKDKVQPQPKQGWSKWDELQYKAAYNLCENSGHTVTSDWLKSIKQRIGWKPSEEQMHVLESAVSSLQSTALESLYNDLEKI